MSDHPDQDLTTPPEEHARVSPPTSEGVSHAPAEAREQLSPDVPSNGAPSNVEDSTAAPSVVTSEVSPAVTSATTAVPLSHPHRQRPDGLLSTVQSLVVTISIAVFVITFIVQAFQIPSGSMEDTLLIGDYLLVDKTHFGPTGHFKPLLPYSRIKRGDIVVFRYPVHPDEHFVKRVVGIPGDRIRLIRRRVFINGVPLEEPYVVYKDRSTDDYRDNFPGGSHFSPHITSKWYMQLAKLVDDGELIVPEGEYFVLGDNRDQSLDSRYWGFVPQESIIGRPLLIYFSFRLPESSDRESGAFARSTSLNDSDGKLAGVRDAISNAFRNIRWNRVLRLIG